MKCQLGVWEFNYEKRDIRDKKRRHTEFCVKGMLDRLASVQLHKIRYGVKFVTSDGHQLVVEDDMEEVDTVNSSDFTKENEVDEVETVPIDEQMSQPHNTEPLSPSPKAKGKSRNPRKPKTSPAVPPVENMLEQLNGTKEFFLLTFSDTY